MTKLKSMTTPFFVLHDSWSVIGISYSAHQTSLGLYLPYLMPLLLTAELFCSQHGH